MERDCPRLVTMMITPRIMLITIITTKSHCGAAAVAGSHLLVSFTQAARSWEKRSDWGSPSSSSHWSSPQSRVVAPVLQGPTEQLSTQFSAFPF